MLFLTLDVLLNPAFLRNRRPVFLYRSASRLTSATPFFSISIDHRAAPGPALISFWRGVPFIFFLGFFNLKI